MKNLIGCFTVSVALSGCIFVPKDVTYYDERCQVYAKKSTLESSNLIAFGACGSDFSCGAALASAGLVSAASLVVSGSISLIENTVYWIETEKDCLAEPKLKRLPNAEPKVQTHDPLDSISIKEGA
ncbi:hypothetical protein BGP78_09395 [Pseudoalteromonas sp. MSK9-3]|uniref:hypothetical protein n=1 Tax=Pseudoalteromonas sp. MSK9-3 TaxID=1897633 RepID=UPI000E6B60D4|nr:hypothetical protein [Pseudoalteromonas sp. MSK9-3]RJE77259.1 hypothetical protein BGP78_09395 [Pseudoalteromonas sp. MSK9-3]